MRIDERRARYPEAVANAARSVAIMRTVLAEAAGRGAEAEPLFARALRSFAAALPQDHPKVVACVENYAGLLREQGGGAAAAALLRQYGRGGAAGTT